MLVSLCDQSSKWELTVRLLVRIRSYTLTLVVSWECFYNRLWLINRLTYRWWKMVATIIIRWLLQTLKSPTYRLSNGYHMMSVFFFSTIETFPSAGSVSTHRNTLCSLSKVLLISFRAGWKRSLVLSLSVFQIVKWAAVDDYSDLLWQFGVF